MIEPESGDAPDIQPPATSEEMAEFNVCPDESIGIAKDKGTTDKILRETRGDNRPVA